MIRTLIVFVVGIAAGMALMSSIGTASKQELTCAESPAPAVTKSTAKEETMTGQTSKPDNKQSTTDLVFTRSFDAPVEKVWQAWTDSELVKQWWGPTGFTCPSAKMDCRAGGTTLVCMRAPKEFGGQDMYSTWRYVAIEPVKRMEYIHNLADKDGHNIDPAVLGMPPDFPRDQRHVVAFESIGSNKTQLTITEYDWTPGHMMEMSKLGMGQCLDKMEAIFAKR